MPYDHIKLTTALRQTIAELNLQVANRDTTIAHLLTEIGAVWNSVPATLQSAADKAKADGAGGVAALARLNTAAAAANAEADDAISTAEAQAAEDARKPGVPADDETDEQRRARLARDPAPPNETFAERNARLAGETPAQRAARIEREDRA